jgi:hypothetical protein
MSRDRRPSEPPSDKAEESANNADGTPMERFKTLTQRLLNVSNKRLQEELKKPKRKKTKGG